MTFSGHSGKIKCMAWSKEDNILVTCGAMALLWHIEWGCKIVAVNYFIYIVQSNQEQRVLFIAQYVLIQIIQFMLWVS